MSNGQQIPGQQIRVPVLQAPTVQRVDVSSGLQAAADAQREIDMRKDSLKANELRLGAAKQLADLQIEAEAQPYDQRTTFFESRANEIKNSLTQNLGMFDGEIKARFESDWSQLYLPYNVDVKHSARKGEIDHHAAVLDDTLTTLARQAAQMPDDRQAAMMVQQAGKSIAVAQHGGILSESDAGDKLREFSRGVEKNRAVALIDANPSQGLRALQDTSRFQSLKEEDRLMLLSRAESKMQHIAAMADHAAAVNERNRKLAGDQIAKEGFDLLAKRQMTEEWLTTHRRTLDTSDYRMLREGTQKGGGTDSAKTLADVYERMYLRGEDVGPDLIGALRRGELAPDTAKSLLDENKSTQGIESPVQQGRKYIAGSLKVSEINPDPAAAQRLANAMASFNQQMREDPKQDPDKLAKTIVKQHSLLDFSEFRALQPLPKYAVGGRNDLDIKATRAATFKAFLAKYGGDKAKMQADPDYLREARSLKAWEDAIKRMQAADDAARGTGR